MNYGTEKSKHPIEISTLKQPGKKIVMHQRAMEIKSIWERLTSDANERIDSRIIWRPRVAITEAKTSIPWTKYFSGLLV